MRPLVIAAALAALAGCNKSNDFTGCDVPSDPSTSRRIDVCPASGFDMRDLPQWRDVSGQVWRGELGVGGAIVRTSPFGAPSSNAQVVTTVAGGFFGPIHNVDLRYDVTVRSDADVLRLESLAFRYVQPSFDGPRDHTDGYRKALLLQLDRTIPSDHAVAFFATGKTAFGVEGDLERGVTVIDSVYDADVTIHALEYVRGKDFLSAIAYGKTEIVASAATPRLAAIHLDPVTDYTTHTLDFVAPAGFQTSTELLLVFSRSSAARAEGVPLRTPVKLPVLPGGTAGFAYHVVSRGPDGTILDSAEKFIGPDPLQPIEVADAPVLLAPAEGSSIDTTTPLSVSGKGLLLHELRPNLGSGSIRIVTRDSVTTLPDFGSVGAPPPKGSYTWTVRAFPTLTFPDAFSGVDAGRYDRSATSKPRTILFR